MELNKEEEEVDTDLKLKGSSVYIFIILILGYLFFKLIKKSLFISIPLKIIIKSIDFIFLKKKFILLSYIGLIKLNKNFALILLNKQYK
jgi:hypothetical protein